MKALNWLVVIVFSLSLSALSGCSHFKSGKKGAAMGAEEETCSGERFKNISTRSTKIEVGIKFQSDG